MGKFNWALSCGVGLSALAIGWPAYPPSASANHQGHERHAGEGVPETVGRGYPVPGAAFQVFVGSGKKTPDANGQDPRQLETAARSVVDAFAFMIQHRIDYPRFDEALNKNALSQVIVEPTVVNRDGKAFAFLVARTNEPGRVNLLVNASSLKEKGYLDRPEQLIAVLAREFQWIVSKADTAPRSTIVSLERNLAQAPVVAERDSGEMSGESRAQALQQLLDTYLRTVDEHNSLKGRSYYEVGSTTLIPPSQPDSTIKLYDIRVREALGKIVREPYFRARTPKAVRSLLSGKIWNVAFVNIGQRDWATRTRVAPEDQAVTVGAQGYRIQPATILVNVYRTAAPDDPFYADTKDLPMGALSPDQLALVIASEIEHNIIEKSMTGHVAQDASTAPK